MWCSAARHRLSRQSSTGLCSGALGLRTRGASACTHEQDVICHSTAQFIPLSFTGGELETAPQLWGASVPARDVKARGGVARGERGPPDRRGGWRGGGLRGAAVEAVVTLTVYTVAKKETKKKIRTTEAIALTPRTEAGQASLAKYQHGRVASKVCHSEGRSSTRPRNRQHQRDAAVTSVRSQDPKCVNVS